MGQNIRSCIKIFSENELQQDAKIIISSIICKNQSPVGAGYSKDNMNLEYIKIEYDVAVKINGQKLHIIT